MLSRVFIIITLMIAAGCNSESKVKLLTSGIFTPVTYSINDQDADGKTIDLGEFLLTDEPRLLTVQIHNKTEYTYTQLALEMRADNEEQSTALSFAPTMAGEIAFPGNEGTCKRSLPSKESCTIKLLLSPREGREYLEVLTVKFKNYVDPEEHVGKVKLLAGMPASLTFTNDKTAYTFGELVGAGSSLIPVVEREDQTPYYETLEVVNAGGLAAKDLKVLLSETCTSALTNTCPSGMLGAYTVLENNCPTSLYPQEKCQVKLQYLPKNKDPLSGVTPEEIKDISYLATVKFDYIKDPTGAKAAMNANFTSVSSNIEARFKVSLANINFETPLVVGNRETRTFRINNVGYREGELKTLEIRDVDNSLLGSCQRAEGTPILECYKGGVRLDLAALPFTLEDRNNCLAPPGQTGTLVGVGLGCIFDITFQPSITYTTKKEFLHLQPYAVFDARWKGLEKITSAKLFNLSASSITAGRLVPTGFTMAGESFAISGTAPGVVDLGRLALQSSSYAKYKKILIKFKNIGDEPVTQLNIKDGSGKVIPVGGTPVTLGAYSLYYYKDVSATEGTCTAIASGQECTLNINFAPIGRNSNDAQENANMFDVTTGIPYKSFVLNYNGGAKFTDTNLKGDPDYTPEPAEMRITAKLIRKGLLQELADDSRNKPTVGADAVLGDTLIHHLYLRNIGTGAIPYIRYTNPPPDADGKNLEMTLISTPDPASLGADYDCMARVDTIATIPADTTPDARAGQYLDLPADKSCVYTIQYKRHDKRLTPNPKGCNRILPLEENPNEGTRFYSRLAGDKLWQYCTQFGAQNISGYYQTRPRFSFYDGDVIDPAEPYGTRFSIPEYQLTFSENTPAKLILNSFEPALTATLYRPEVQYPALPSGQLAFTVPEKWFYGLLGDFFYDTNDPLFNSAFNAPYIKGRFSRNYVPTMAAFADRAQYDYILYLGSFPKGSPQIVVPLSLNNAGTASAKLLSLDDTVKDASFIRNEFPSVVPTYVPGGSLLTNFSYKFNPTTAGEKRMVLEFEYETGKHEGMLIFDRSITPSYTDPDIERVTQKILVVANVEEDTTYGKLDLTVTNYEVVEVPGSPPQENIESTETAPLSWNNHPLLKTLVFDTIKIAVPTANDVYAKKVLTFTNNTLVPIKNLDIRFRMYTSSLGDNAPPNSFKTNNTGSNCGTTLNPGQSCQRVVTYQPTVSDVSRNLVMTMIYEMADHRYVMQNVGIALTPQSPGQIVAFGPTSKKINYKLTPTSGSLTRTSYPYGFGTEILNAPEKTLVWDKTSTTFKKLEFKNNQGTKASLLLSYHRYLSAHSKRGYTPASSVPTKVVPTPTEYRTHTDGYSYVKIHQMNYSNGSPRIIIEANKACLFGDDSDGDTNSDGVVDGSDVAGPTPHHKKGFDKNSVSPCFALMTFNYNFEFLGRALSSANGDDMRDVASQLWYYSVNRSSTAEVWIHIEGTIKPDPVLNYSLGQYSNVLATDNKRASFDVPTFVPTSPDVGNIVGFRVLLSLKSTIDAYDKTLSYIDIRPGAYNPATTYNAQFTTGLVHGAFYWFRTVAIRKDTRFVDSSSPKRFLNLGPNEYLAEGPNTILRVAVPPLNHYYFHANKKIVQKNLASSEPFETYDQSLAKCTNLPKANIGGVQRTYGLIDIATWELLLQTPMATNYPDMTIVTHWLAEPQVNIDTRLAATPGFLANQASQQLDGPKVYYMRHFTNPTYPVNWAVGGLYGQSEYSDYDSYVDPTYSYATARCMLSIP